MAEAFILRETASGGINKAMVIVALFGSLVAGGAFFAFLKNAGAKSSDTKYTKLDLG
jgi:hypothetical protein